MPFKFVSDEGRALIRKILRDTVAIEPHDHQLEALSYALDRVSVLSVTYTGSGKSGYIYMLAIILNALRSDPALCPQADVPRDPVIVVICPTIALEEDLEKKLKKYNIDTFLLNKSRKEELQTKGRDIFTEAADVRHRVLLMTPEMLVSTGVRRGLLDRQDFKRRQAALMVDEAHLLDAWGQRFRTEYKQIGHVRQLFAERVPLLAFTATLRKGEPGASPQTDVCRFLGLHAGEFHAIKRSNARYETKVIVRPFRHNEQSTSFADLDWIVDTPGKVLVFCKSIKMGSKIADYLLSKWPNPSHTNRPHTYNRLHSDAFNTETIRLVISSSKIVVITTDALSVGIDMADIDTVVVLDPVDIDDAWQKGGRAGRDLRLVPHPRLIIYVPAKVFSAPEAAMAAAQAKKPQDRKDGRPPDVSIPKLVAAACKLKEIDAQYDNNPEEEPCGCHNCQTRPRACFPSPCTCSGCVREPAVASASTSTSAGPDVPPSKKLTPAMRLHAATRLAKWRREILARIPPEDDASEAAILSDYRIEQVVSLLATSLDQSAISTLYEAYQSKGISEQGLCDSPVLAPMLKGARFLGQYSGSWVSALNALHLELEDMRVHDKQQKAARDRERRQEKRRKELFEASQVGIMGERPPSMHEPTEEEIEAFEKSRAPVYAPEFFEGDLGLWYG
ncbi:P-loop containing nucleoside triphosphate hydrolase protein [Schizophyllum commune]